MSPLDRSARHTRRHHLDLGMRLLSAPTADHNDQRHGGSPQALLTPERHMNDDAHNVPLVTDAGARAPDVTEHEYHVLEMLAGQRPGEWGAWVAACLEFLSEAGLCTHGPKYQITIAGRKALEARGDASQPGNPTARHIIPDPPR